MCVLEVIVFCGFGVLQPVFYFQVLFGAHLRIEVGGFFG